MFKIDHISHSILSIRNQYHVLNYFSKVFIKNSDKPFVSGEVRAKR